VGVALEAGPEALGAALGIDELLGTADALGATDGAWLGRGAGVGIGVNRPPTPPSRP
jgi:hypothetical protein